MGHTSHLLYFTSINTRRFLLSSSFLLLFLFFFHSVHGRPFSQEPTKDERIMEVELIGSRPPRCEQRCISCSHCVAVQVPIAPQNKLGNFFHAVIYTRGDESTNYKPLNWKCKCGDSIINP